MSKTKLSEAQDLLRTAGATIRSQQEKIASLEGEIDRRDREKRAQDVARMMEHKGLHDDLSFEEKVAHIRDNDDRLDVVEEAVKMASADLSFGHAAEEGPGANGTTLDSFLNFIATGDE